MAISRLKDNLIFWALLLWCEMARGGERDLRTVRQMVYTEKIKTKKQTGWEERNSYIG